jgi:hypothetical protein
MSNGKVPGLIICEDLALRAQIEEHVLPIAVDWKMYPPTLNDVADDNELLAALSQASCVVVGVTGNSFDVRAIGYALNGDRPVSLIVDSSTSRPLWSMLSGTHKKSGPFGLVVGSRSDLPTMFPGARHFQAHSIRVRGVSIAGLLNQLIESPSSVA